MNIEYRWTPSNMGVNTKCLECNRKYPMEKFITEEIRIGQHKKLLVKLCPECDIKFVYNKVFGKKIWKDFKRFIGRN